MMQSASISQNEPILVVGGGMVGIATAIWLQRDGQKVTIIDKGEPADRASYGNAGVLASASVLPAAMPGIVGKLPKMLMSASEPVFMRWGYLLKLLPWALKYLSHANETDARRIAVAMSQITGNSYEDHLALSEGTHAKQHIKACDFAVLYQNQAKFHDDALAWSIRKELGFNWNEYHASARDEYDPIFPDHLEFMAALTGHGQITDPGQYMKDLRAHFIKSGGKIIQAEVTDILRSDNKILGVMTKPAPVNAPVNAQVNAPINGPINGKAVAITAGAWSPLLTKKLGIKIPVEAESGYHMEFWNPSFMPRRPTLVPSKKMIFSPMEGRLRVAGAVDLGGLKNTGREAGFQLIRSAVKEVLPGLKFEHETSWFGHRPAPTDSIPVIDQMPGMKGLYFGFGHQHVGLTGSARTGQLLAQLICGRRPNIDLSPFRVSRFQVSNFSSNNTKTTQSLKQQHHFGGG